MSSIQTRHAPKIARSESYDQDDAQRPTYHSTSFSITGVSTRLDTPETLQQHLDGGIFSQDINTGASHRHTGWNDIVVTSTYNHTGRSITERLTQSINPALEDMRCQRLTSVDTSITTAQASNTGAITPASPLFKATEFPVSRTTNYNLDGPDIDPTTASLSTMLGLNASNKFYSCTSNSTVFDRTNDTSITHSPSQYKITPTLQYSHSSSSASVITTSPTSYNESVEAFTDQSADEGTSTDTNHLQIASWVYTTSPAELTFAEALVSRTFEESDG